MSGSQGGPALVPATRLYGTTQTLTANGNSADIDTTQFRTLWLSVYANGVATGTTPSLQVFWDQKDSAGNYMPVANSVALTTAPNYSFVAVTAYPLSLAGRLRWVVTGTTPSFTLVTIDLVGRS